MSVKIDSAAPDGFVVHSFADDADIACKDYVRKKLGIERERPQKANGSAKPFSPTVARYTYRAADGSPYLQVHRTAAKDFYQHHWNGEKWASSAPSGPKIPYRLPELLAAPSTAPIYVCEGEKDCDNLAKLGFVATCNAGGADPGTGKKWTPDLNQYFKGRTVYIVADNDDSGRKHAQHVARNLDPVTASVRVVELPDLPPKGDVSDWLLKDTAGVKLTRLCQAAPLWEAEAHRPIETKTDADAEIARLAALTPVQYERERKAAAERLDIRATILDKLVQAERPEDDSKQGRAISFPEPEPWPEPVSGARLLDGIADAISKHIILADAARDTTALWSVHTYLLDGSLVSPRLAVTSPEKRCGKTTLLDVCSRLALKPLSAAHVTAAAMFRTVEAYRPTLLIDEADTFLRDNEELRGIINSGHRKGGSVLRTVGDDHEPRAFATYAACAIALIGRLPETLHDRSVIVALKRRLPSEPIKSFRSDRTEQLDALARQAARWASDNAERVANADPKMPEGVFNREADNWRPLLAIADIGRSKRGMHYRRPTPPRMRTVGSRCCWPTSKARSRSETPTGCRRRAWSHC
jgi:putative DNA primase/helicase